MGRIKTCQRYVTDISRPHLLSLVDLGGGGNFEIEVSVTYERVTRS